MLMLDLTPEQHAAFHRALEAVPGPHQLDELMAESLSRWKSVAASSAFTPTFWTRSRSC